MGELVADFYKTLYRPEDVTNIDQVLDTVPTRVTAAINEGMSAICPRGGKDNLIPDVPDKDAPYMVCQHIFFSGIGGRDTVPYTTKQ